ncbi:amidase [Nocardia tenerifensis]|uniref:amidase n=1 Tax=Nocardia tenerifensis TaxID=228006 RepID=A0A318K0L7_9NOCA|nr:amidase family protein [Nocardia tenerifensis]PXX63348.1 amidase [Nocardia tenerifensis]
MQNKATAVADDSAETETSGPETAARTRTKLSAFARVTWKKSTPTPPVVAQPPAAGPDVEATPAEDSPLGADDQILADKNTSRGPVSVIAAGVRDGSLSATEVVDATLARIVAEHRNTNAFSVVRAEKARSEAASLEQRADLDVLPLAGVPVAIKHDIGVAGETIRAGSLATDARPVADDHPVVRRLRAAGAVIVGLTTVPELGLWGTTDTPDRITSNPWNVARSSGGSSGGSAAAVAAGLVPIAHGNDGLGSIRVPAACCGVFGIKPGRYTVPAEIGVDAWSGMIENGVLATTVGDAALALSVLAARPDLSELDPPDRLRIGLAVAAPYRCFPVDRHWTNAARTAASVAAAAGHHVEPAGLPYGDALPSVFLRWLAGGARDAAALPHLDRLQPRTRRHLALGRLVQRLRLVRPAQVDRVEARLLDYFERYDVVITPTLACPPPKAKAWHGRGWLANVLATARFSPFTPLWNLVGWPAVSIPMGMHPDIGTPVAAQLAGPPGSESTLLRLSAQLESLHPWRRTIN